ncbi:MAG: carboxylesterase family protein [Actinomycetota bacterium]|nr:carboxylesterase family protein [Actinomycetota bacterium]
MTNAVIRTAAGTLEGSPGEGVIAFLGIPYAAAPYGPHRFAAPAPVEPWDGVRPATAYGPTALKTGYPAPIDKLLPEPAIDGEACLNLNVWTPEPGRTGLPVLVWIHGGAFQYGTGAVADYAGDTFARHGVVTVTINYRLGVDGFACLEGAPPNRGLLDQVAALRWVRDNIAAFGGDPDQVTIAGESAGAMSVVSLLAMPSAAGLFHRVIAQSGAGHHALTESTARRLSGYLAQDLGVAPTATAMAGVAHDRLLQAQNALAAGPTRDPNPERWGEVATNVMVFEPVIDGDILPGLPIDVIAGGGGAEVDLLVGTNRDEQRLFIVPTGLMDIIDDNVVDLAAAGWSIPPAVTDLYRANRHGKGPGDVLCDIATDWFFRIPAVRLAEARTPRHGRVYAYEFAWRSSAFGGKLGACHAIEIPFVFDHLQRTGDDGPNLFAEGEPLPQDLADTVHGAWTEFISGGSPGWAPYDLDRRPTMTFAASSSVVDDPRGDERAAWDGHR